MHGNAEPYKRCLVAHATTNICLLTKQDNAVLTRAAKSEQFLVESETFYNLQGERFLIIKGLK